MIANMPRWRQEACLSAKAWGQHAVFALELVNVDIDALEMPLAALAKSLAAV